MIVDANVVVYWSTETAFGVAAEAILVRTDLCAPDFILIEAADALMKYFRAGTLSQADVNDGLRLVQESIPDLVESAELLPKAIELSASLNHRIYDCLYLALALDRREPLATADRRLAALAQGLSIETLLIEPA